MTFKTAQISAFLGIFKHTVLMWIWNFHHNYSCVGSK